MLRKDRIVLLCILFLVCTTAISCNCPTGEFAGLDMSSGGTPFQHFQLATSSDGIVSGLMFGQGTCSDYDVSGTSNGIHIAFRGEIQEPNPDCCSGFDVTVTADALCAIMDGEMLLDCFPKPFDYRLVPCALVGGCE